MSLFADQGREQLRGAYCEAWRKWRAGLPLQPLEAQLVEVIRVHPEYHTLLESGAAGAADQPNPFLHLGLHLALREQIGTDRPRGIVAIHRRLSSRLGSHEAEHRMLEVLGSILWEAQRSGHPPDEAVYRERLQELL